MKYFGIIGVALLSLALSSVPAKAQWPPEKTVRIIVPLTAGAVGDILMRLLAEQVSNKTNRTIIVELRPGGGTMVGTEAAARSPPDGTTLLLVANSLLINSHVKTRLPYDPFTSFAPVCLLAYTRHVLVVNNTSSFQSFAQFIAAARQGPLTIGATGPNTTQHVAIEALKQASKANLTFVPFGGDPPALNSLLGGHLDAGLNTYTGVRPHLGAALRPLAVGSRERVAELPDVPTFAEAGFDIHANTFVGLVVPAKTPEQVTAHIAAHFRSALDTPEINTKVKALGLTPVGLCGEDFATYLRQHDERIARIVKAANMKVE